ncbi:MAG: polymer-forming cytoskeletal protein [Methanomicrobiaceae archaeon]|uniref:Acyltransferase n=1 Tax=hydrocarbon metagenome TaxID=938273 RepID=A0A0W8FJP2_9ZZZZ|nr:polymer-forming cytoskeletal protein [Methanomicrobiaceae archaeon]MDD5418979.1 polymer-forming cytoskeletal protein [Methanomicrobiaceae archaeon]
MGEVVQDWLRQCLLPDSTELQERVLKTDVDIVIGDRCQIDYGLQGADIVVCEFCRINGDVIADGDIRIDNWCEIEGDVVAGEDAYLGEGVKIRGRLQVTGDLDIGDNVQIERGFEAKGWISIRNPMPVVLYLVLYLVTLLGIEREDELDSFLDELCGKENSGDPLVIPASTVLNMKTFTVPAGMAIGSGCRLHGNIRAGSVVVMENTTLFGSLRAQDSIVVSRGSVIHGDVRGGGDVTIERGVHVLGDVACRKLTLHEEARVDGVIRAPEGLKIERGA